jgi:hypothetical protein
MLQNTDTGRSESDLKEPVLKEINVCKDKKPNWLTLNIDDIEVEVGYFKNDKRKTGILITSVTDCIRLTHKPTSKVVMCMIHTTDIEIAVISALKSLQLEVDMVTNPYANILHKPVFFK